MTISGTLPDPSVTEPKFWSKKRTIGTKALAGLLLGAALAGGVLEKAGNDTQVADLQAQVAAMQAAGDSTGAAPGVGLVSKKGSSKVTHPKALSPSQHKYTCTKN
jgi:hypothetical protein